jgi:hypothetical protein
MKKSGLGRRDGQVEKVLFERLSDGGGPLERLSDGWGR